MLAWAFVEHPFKYRVLDNGSGTCFREFCSKLCGSPPRGLPTL